jgi:hypothetical protein
LGWLAGSPTGGGDAMIRRHCRVCAEWHSLDEPWPLPCREHFRHHNIDWSPAPGIIRDGLDDMQSMVDGKRYTSKRGYYASLKAHGNLEIDDRPRMRDANRPQQKSDVALDVKRAWETL